MKNENEEEITEEEFKAITLKRLNCEHLTELPDLEAELRKVEKQRRKINFEKRFNRLKRNIEKTDKTLRKKGWSEKDLLQDIQNTLDLFTYVDGHSPSAALGVAVREHRVLTKYIGKLKETLDGYRAELKEKYGLDNGDDDSLFVNE